MILYTFVLACDTDEHIFDNKHNINNYSNS